MRKFRPLLWALAGLLAIATTVAAFDRPLVLYNHTASLPLGWYLVGSAPTQTPAVAVFPVPEHVRSLVLARRWLPDDAYLSKPIAAQTGDYVCIGDGRITVNGVDYGAVQAADSEGRPMPIVEHCGAVGEGEFWALIPGRSDSFDSRYIGGISTQTIVGYARALWTWPASS